jgi:hypothetical protein
MLKLVWIDSAIKDLSAGGESLVEFSEPLKKKK